MSEVHSSSRLRQARAVDLDRRALQVGVTGAVAAVGALLIAVPPTGTERLALLAFAATVATMFLPPALFVAACLTLFGASQLSEAKPVLALAGVNVYSSDVLLVFVLVRAALPLPRFTGAKGRTGLLLRLSVLLWAAVMAIAAVRGLRAGSSLANVIRLDLPLIYFPIYYFGFARVVREKRLRDADLIRTMAVVAVGFVAWMFLMRLTGQRFESPSQTSGRLGEVVISNGDVLHRDYGFASAFIVYPLLALGAIAYLVHAGRRTFLAAALIAAGVGATVVTLIRGEIFGFVLGTAVILVLGTTRWTKVAMSRTKIVALLVASSVALALLFVAFDPATGQGVVERALPGVFAQSNAATENASFRVHALDVGVSFARDHPAGLGFVTTDTLASNAIDPAYLVHSAPTLLLVYAGWPGLIATLLALIALARRSFKIPARIPWMHAFFVASLTLLTIYGFGASGLVGQSWIIGFAAFIISLRFAPAPTSENER